MSWSKSFGAGLAQSLEDLANLAADLNKQDEANSASGAVTSGHRNQAEIVQAMVAAAKVGAPDGCEVVQVSAHGHVNEDGTGNVGCNIQFGLRP